MNKSHLVWAIVVGVGIGTVSILSPMAIWFTVAMIALFAWAGRGLGASERRWVLAMLGIAVALRLMVIAGLFLGADHSGQVFVSFPFDGDGRALKMRSIAMLNVWLGVPIDEPHLAFAFDRGFGWSSFVPVLSYLQFLIGPAPYGIHLFNVALFVTGCIVLFRTMRRVYGPVVGVAGLAIVLFFPSLFFWSITAMKEAFQFLLVSIGLVATARIWHAKTWTGKIGALVLAGVAIAATLSVRRDVGLAIGLGGTVAGLLAFVATRRRWLCVAAIVMMPIACVAVLRQPAVQHRLLTVLQSTAVKQLGNVQTEGHSYKLLEQRFYSGEPLESMTMVEGYRYMARALVSFVALPTPWQVSSVPELIFLPEQMLWYVLIVSAVAGVRSGLRRDAITTCLLCGYVVVGAGAISIGSGNVGTFVRHRDIVTPYIVWLSVLGLEGFLARISARARTAAPPHRPLEGGLEPACL